MKPCIRAERGRMWGPVLPGGWLRFALNQTTAGCCSTLAHLCCCVVQELQQLRAAREWKSKPSHNANSRQAGHTPRAWKGEHDTAATSLAFAHAHLVEEAVDVQDADCRQGGLETASARWESNANKAMRIDACLPCNGRQSAVCRQAGLSSQHSFPRLPSPPPGFWWYPSCCHVVISSVSSSVP